jgi:DNA (cytosine-5)-methyltransferase 1
MQLECFCGIFMTLHTESDDVVSLFSGAGGFSYGFKCAGMKPLFGAEIDKDACNSYQNNVQGICHQFDLSKTEPKIFNKFLGNKSPFAIIGGPPCQGFSSAGARKNDDPRNNLVFNYLKIVAEINPRWFIFENVEGLLTSGSSKDLPALIHEFIKIGYSVRVEKINLAGYGVPQTRKRVLIIGNRLGINFSFPSNIFSYNSGKAKNLSNKPFAPSIFDALAGLGNSTNVKGQRVKYATSEPINDFDMLMRMNNIAHDVSLHFDNTSPDDQLRNSLLGAGQTMKDLPENLWHESFKKRANRRVSDGTATEKRGGAPSGIKRLNGELQSLTITGAACREFIHPAFDRPLTIRECARLQTFPDNYEFSGATVSVMQQIGNAVPPLAAKIFAEHIRKIDGMAGTGLIDNPCKPSLLGYSLTEASGMSPALIKTDSYLSQLLVNKKENLLWQE